MAREWYLMTPPHDQISGFESDAFDDFAQEAFTEVLDSAMAVDIELCNYDLSVVIPMKAVVKNNLQETKLKTLSREVLLPINSCKAGMYIKYKNRYWIIVGLVDDNGIYEKAIVTLCNYRLTWLNDNKQIVQRWASVKSASQYNHGETSLKYFFVRSDQLLIITPDDDECLLLNTGKRFIIDRRCEIYEKNMDGVLDFDNTHPVITYRLTRSDSVLYDYQDSGYYEFMVYQDEQHDGDGYYIIDGKGYWLCEEPQTDNENTLSLKIEYDSLDIYNGLDAGLFTAVFYNQEGNIDNNVEPQWNFDCDFIDSLDIDYIGNSVVISVNNRNLINKSFVLSLTADGYETVSETISIKAFI